MGSNGKRNQPQANTGTIGQSQLWNLDFFRDLSVHKECINKEKTFKGEKRRKNFYESSKKHED